MRVFVAGASGAIGRVLLPRLIAAGHEVTGLSRTRAGADTVRALGARPALGDALDRESLRGAVMEARPEAVVHQLTDLATALAQPPRRLAKALGGTNRLRTIGMRNLVEAAKEAGAGRLVAQSVAFFYAPGPGGLRTESDPLALDGSLPVDSVRAVAELERATTAEPGIVGVVLRYGSFYGPGTAYASDGPFAAMMRRRAFPILGRGAGLSSFIHVDDAAAATVRALDGPPGIYNVVDDEPAPLREWLPVYAEALAAPRPLRVPLWLGRLVAGSYVAFVATRAPGASNARARRELGWAPRWSSWRQGFREALG